jgi:TRAP-type C4-dicarboxylate transport system substrate-binding protein
MKRNVMIVLALILVFSLVIPQSWAAGKVQWKFTNIMPAGQIYTQYFNRLAEEITKATNGEVTVTNYPAGELPYKGTDLLKVTQKGLVDMAEIAGGFVYGELPLLAIADLPYIALNEEQLKTYRGVFLPYIYEELRKVGVEPLTWTIYGPRQIVSRKPTKNLEDIKGQKVRTSGGLQDLYIKLWGAVPAFVVWAEVYPAAQRGIVDAIMTATMAIEQSKVYEVCPYFFKIDGPVTHTYISVNKKSWNALSKKNKEIVRQVTIKWGEVWDQKVGHELDDEALKRMVEKKQLAEVSQLSLEEKMKTRKELIPEFRSYIKKHMQPKGPEIFEKIVKALKME